MRHHKKSIIAVTGASGHIGANLIRTLCEEKKHVRVLDFYASNAYAGLDIEIVKGNILDQKIVSEFIDGADLVYHLAGKIHLGEDRNIEMEKVNILGTRNIVQACLKNKVSRLIHFSSIHAMSPHPANAIVDEDRPLITTQKAHWYDRTKAEGEMEIYKAINEGLNAVIIVPCGVIGPFDFIPSAMGRMLMDLKNKDVVFLCAGGFHWVDVRDVVSGAISAANKGRSGERYILSGEWLSLREIGEIVDEFYGKRTRYVTLPYWVAHLVAHCAERYGRLIKRPSLFTPAAINTLQNYRYVSIEKAKNELGFQSRSIRNSIVDSLNWYHQEGKI